MDYLSSLGNTLSTYLEQTTRFLIIQTQKAIEPCIRRFRVKREKFNSLVKTVGETHPQDWHVQNLYRACKLVVKRDFSNFMQHRFGLSGEKHGKRFYTYYYNYRPYQFPVDVPSGPVKSYQIFGVKDEEEKGEEKGENTSPINITDSIEMYMGPNQDFHNITFTPKFFGFSRISFIDIESADVITFEENDEMVL